MDFKNALKEIGHSETEFDRDIDELNELLGHKPLRKVDTINILLENIDKYKKIICMMATEELVNTCGTPTLGVNEN
jgi:hypothetical protein